MIEAAMGGEKFTWPAGTYVNNEKYQHVMMAMPTVIDATGCHYTNPEGTPEEMAALQASYEHLVKMRDEIIELGIVPAVADWGKENKNL
jgi:malate dehydrogenase